MILQVDAGADVIGDHRNPFANLGLPIAVADIYFAVLFTESDNFCPRVFNDVAVSTVGNGDAAIAGERFGSSIDHDLAGYRVADHRTHDARRTIIEGTEPAAQGVHVIEDVGTGTDFCKLR